MNERNEQLRLDPTRDLLPPKEKIVQLEMDMGVIKSELVDLSKLKLNPLNVQTGGDHYKDMKIQPIVYSMENNLNACQHSVVKYISRYKSKNGLEDLKKAKHFIDLLMKIEYDYSE